MSTAEGVTLPAHDHFERFVIFVSAVLALCHTGFLRRKLGSPGQGGRTCEWVSEARLGGGDRSGTW
jgi:hypothetical protein